MEVSPTVKGQGWKKRPKLDLEIEKNVTEKELEAKGIRQPIKEEPMAMAGRMVSIEEKVNVEIVNT